MKISAWWGRREYHNIITGTFVGVWGVWFALKWWQAAGEAPSIWSIFSPLFSGMTISLPLMWMARFLVMLSIAAAICFGCYGAGGAITRILGKRRLSGTEYILFRILFGFGIMGAIYLGLGLGGLYYPSVIILAFLCGSWVPAVLDVSACRRPGLGALKSFWWLALAPFLMAAALAVLPDMNSDVYDYHLANPAHFLKVHKITVVPALPRFCMPQSTEMNYSLAIILGNDAIAHFIQMVPFLSACILLANWAASGGVSERAGLRRHSC